MWFWLIPLLAIIYFAVALLAGPTYVWLSRTNKDLQGHEWDVEAIAAFFWPVVLPVALVFCGIRGYSRFLGKYYERLNP